MQKRECGEESGVCAMNADKRIVLAEENMALRRLLVRELRREGLSVRGVSSGNAAMSMLAKGKLLQIAIVGDVLQADELTERIKACNPEAKIVLISSRRRRSAKSLRGSVDCIIAKPFAVSELAGKVRELGKLSHEKAV